MEQVLIDTNAILSFLTDRNPAQKKTVMTLTERSLKGELEIILAQHVLSETIFTLLNVYGIGKKTVIEMVRDLVAHPGVRLENQLIWAEVLDLWAGLFSDFGDAVIASVARAAQYSVFTFDSKFGKKLKSANVTWINHQDRT